MIFIYADDLGKGMLSNYGQKNFTTPNIDKLFEKGAAFEQAYGCMLSAPARASLLTGYHDCRKDKWNINGGGRFVSISSDDQIKDVEKQIDKNDLLLPKDDLYLPQVFKKAGYVTAEIGKLEWGFTASRNQLKAHGWDYYYGYLDHVRCHGYYPPYLFDNGEVDYIEGNTRSDCGKSIEQETPETYAERWNMGGKESYSQGIFLEKILKFINDNKNRPFFLYHPTQLPHGPVSVPRVDPEIENNKNLTSIEKEYASMVKLLDDNVGVIMEELKRLGLEKNTIVVFASDNGHEIYYSQKGRCEKPYKNIKENRYFDDYTEKYYSSLAGDVFNGNAGMAGLKRSNLQGGVNVPLAVYWKGHFKSQKNNQVVSIYDMLTTVADALDVELKTKKDGISVLPLLTKKEKLSKERYVVFGSNYGPAIVMNDGWKLRYYMARKVFELYNIFEDPKEINDQSSEYPLKVEQLKTLLLKECNGDLENGVNRAG
ncbi:MAG: sulfatase-like hydrolase/transferase [Bacteroidales bacterium]|nr:sulfatase-like hydrolase/transferase [Bacteroidales bacterium]